MTGDYPKIILSPAIPVAEDQPQSDDSVGLGK